MPSRLGSANKNRQFLLNRMKDMLGEDFDPVIQMAKNAVKLQQIADENLANCGYIEDAEGKEIMTYAESLINANKEFERVAPYIAPKLKAVEISQEEGEDGKPKEWKIQVVKPSDT